MINQLSGQAERNILNVGIKGSGDTQSLQPASTRPGKISSENAPAAITRDSVVLSDEARTLSQSVRDLNHPVDAREKEPQKRVDAAQEKATYFEVVKYFPPFLGNLKRLEVLQNYPQLLHEVESMMVPPPFDVTTAPANANDTQPADTLTPKSETP